jgi:hypothetical protein
MANSKSMKLALVEGRAALIVIDIQTSTFASIANKDRSIKHMDGYADRVLKARAAIDKARECNIPVYSLHLVFNFRNLTIVDSTVKGLETRVAQ